MPSIISDGSDPFAVSSFFQGFGVVPNRITSGAVSTYTLRELAAALQDIYLGTVAVTTPDTSRVFQRDTLTGGLYGKGVGAVTLAVNPTDPVIYTEYQVLDAMNPTTVLVDWSTGVPPLNAGAQTITITAPAGVVPYLFRLRFNHDEGSIVSTTAPVYVGDVIAIAGQSLAETFVTTAVTSDTATLASLGVTVNTAGQVYVGYASNTGAFPAVPDPTPVNYPPSLWVNPTDGTIINGTGVAEFLRLVISQTGCAAAVVGYVVGGTAIDSWLPGYSGTGTDHNVLLKNVLTRAGSKFCAFIWWQGHYESKNGNTSANYLSQLVALRQDLEDTFPASGDFKLLIGTIPGIGAYGSGPDYIEMVRRTAKAYVASDANARYVDALDTTLWADLVHQSQAGSIIAARHFYRHFMEAVIGRATTGYGPRIVSASRAFGSVNLDLTVTNPGTTLVGVGTYANQFKVFPAGTTAGALTVNSVDLSVPTRVRLVLSATPADPIALDVHYRRPPDTAPIVAAGIYDDVVDSVDLLTRGRQLVATASAIPCVAPSYTITVSTPAPAAVNTSFTVSGTYSGTGAVVPSALQYSWDSGATWFTPSSPTIGGGTYSFDVSTGVKEGVFSLWVRDAVATTALGVSASFVVLDTVVALTAIASPLFGLDAAAASTHFHSDAAGTVQAVVGGRVLSISDLSGSGHRFTQATTTQGPVLAANIKNSRPGLRFTGTLQQFLGVVGGSTLAEDLRVSGGFTSLVVFTPASVPSLAADVMTIGTTNALSGYGKTRLGQALTAGSIRVSLNSDTVLSSASVGAGAGANTLMKVVGRWNGTTIKNAVNALTEVVATPSGSRTNTWTGAYIGASNDNVFQFFFDGWIHEVRIWNSAASDAERTALLAYATTKWGS